MTPAAPVVHCAVVGHPVGHSLSPTIHRAAYRLLGLVGWEYGLHDLVAEEFDAFVDTRDATWRGLSVTMPHKEAAARQGRPDADVQLTGVANTLVWHADGRTAHNTDIAGFGAALAPGGVPDRACVLGAGATARSALVALARMGVATVEVRARSEQRAAQVASWAAGNLGFVGSCVVGAWGGAVPAGTDLVVSTLPADAAAPVVGGLGLADGVAAVFDVAYHPWPSPLGAAALASGVRVLDGVDLLVHQAVEQVRLMTGLAVDAAPLLSAARAELRRRADA